MIADDKPPGDGCEDPKLLTAGDLAKRLRISIRQVRRLDKSGSVPRPLKIGACVRWDPDEIDRWVKAGAPERSVWEKHRDAEVASTVEDTICER